MSGHSIRQRLAALHGRYLRGCGRYGRVAVGLLPVMTGLFALRMVAEVGRDGPGPILILAGCVGGLWLLVRPPKRWAEALASTPPGAAGRGILPPDRPPEDWLPRQAAAAWAAQTLLLAAGVALPFLVIDAFWPALKAREGVFLAAMLPLCGGLMEWLLRRHARRMDRAQVWRAAMPGLARAVHRARATTGADWLPPDCLVLPVGAAEADFCAPPPPLVGPLAAAWAAAGNEARFAGRDGLARLRRKGQGIDVEILDFATAERMTSRGSREVSSHLGGMATGREDFDLAWFDAGGRRLHRLRGRLNLRARGTLDAAEYANAAAAAWSAHRLDRYRRQIAERGEATFDCGAARVRVSAARALLCADGGETPLRDWALEKGFLHLFSEDGKQISADTWKIGNLACLLLLLDERKPAP